MADASFDPASYPGPRADGPVLVHAGEIHPLEVDGPLPAPLRSRAGACAPVLEVQHDIRWSVAYGSNASPRRLVDKGLDGAGAVLLPARLHGWEPVFEARQTGYGSVPLSLVPSPDTRIDVWVLGVHPDHLDELDRTEGRVADGTLVDVDGRDTVRHAPPGTYVLGRVGDLAVADRFALCGGLAYLPGPDTRLQHAGEEWRAWPAYDQAEAAAWLGPPGRLAPQTPDPVLGPWPSTPLEDLPLFVYGTLQPGEAAFGRVADHVEVLGPATTAGRLWDTGNGWPAAVFHPDGAGPRQVHGTLLAPKDADAASRLLAEVDAYEGVPELFGRVSVPVTTDGDGTWRWAIAYAWAGDGAPGRALQEGRWRPR